MSSQLRPRFFVRPIPFLAALGMIGVVVPDPAVVRGAEPASSLTLVERSVIQDQGSWQVEYRLRYNGATVLAILPGEIQGKVEGWVSNSRVASHALPRWSSLVLLGPSGSS